MVTPEYVRASGMLGHGNAWVHAVWHAREGNARVRADRYDSAVATKLWLDGAHGDMVTWFHCNNVTFSLTLPQTIRRYEDCEAAPEYIDGSTFSEHVTLCNIVTM